jgi:hypothetical protein
MRRTTTAPSDSQAPKKEAAPGEPGQVEDSLARHRHRMTNADGGWQSSVPIQKFESSQIRVAVAELFWAARRPALGATIEGEFPG